MTTRRFMGTYKWEFPKIRGTLYNKDPTIQGTILGSPIFGNSQIGLRIGYL